MKCTLPRDTNCLKLHDESLINSTFIIITTIYTSFCDKHTNNLKGLKLLSLDYFDKNMWPDALIFLDFIPFLYVSQYFTAEYIIFLSM